MRLLKTFLALIALAFAVSATSCKTAEQRRQKQFTKLDAVKYKCDHSEKLKGVPEQWTLKNFPIKTKYLPGKPVFLPGTPIIKKGETIYRDINCDSLNRLGIKNGSVKCPPCDTVEIHDTTRIVDTFYAHSEAEISLINKTTDSLRGVCTSKTEQALKSHQNAVKYRSWLLWIGGIALVALVGLGYRWYKNRQIAMIKKAGRYIS